MASSFAFPSMMFEETVAEAPVGPDEETDFRSMGLGGALVHFGPQVVKDLGQLLVDPYAGNPFADIAGNFVSAPRRPAAMTSPAVTGMERSGKTGPALMKSSPEPMPAGAPQLQRPTPAYPMPAAWAPYKAPERGAPVKAIFDAAGNVVGGSNVEGSDVFQQGVASAPVTAGADPALERIHNLAGAVDAGDAAQVNLMFNSMSPFEQQLAQERLGVLAPLLSQRQRERELSRAESAAMGVREADVGVYGAKQALDEASVQRRVLQGKTTKEWIDDRGVVFAQQMKADALQDPAGREKRGLPPTKLMPQEEQEIARQAFAMAQRQLDSLLLASQFPQIFRYQERAPGE